MVSSGITNDSLSKGKVDPCRVCCLAVKANSVLCVQCGKWTHGRCAGVKRVAAKLKDVLLAEILREYWNRGAARGIGV